MRYLNITLILVAILAVSGPLRAKDMSGGDLKSLLASSLTMKLGGPGEGYEGSIKLKPDGTGFGSVTLNSGESLVITGTWTIEGNRFCRKWKYNSYKKECETWRMVGENKVEVLVKGKKIGVNSW